jgi:hypothetical protein
MSPLASHRDLEDVEGGHHRAGTHRHRSYRPARQVVHAVDGADRKPLEQPLLDHFPRSALVFLRRLEDEMDGAAKPARLREIAGGTEQHRGMTVMTAGVHRSGVGRPMGEVVGFANGQGVHVGAQRDRGSVAGDEGADDAGPGQSPMDRDAEFGKMLGDERRRQTLLERQFGIGMQMPPPGGHLLVLFGDPFDDRQGSALLSDATCSSGSSHPGSG